MKLKSVIIENFRAIKQLYLPLDPQLTVLIGDNAAGKTTILDAIAHALSPLPFHLMKDLNDNLRQFYHTFGLENFRITDFEKQTFASECRITIELLEAIEARYDPENLLFSEWSYMRAPGMKEAELSSEFDNYINDLFNLIITRNPDINLPLLSYYNNKRGNFSSDLQNRHYREENQTHPRFLALHNTLGGTPQFWGMFDWFVEQENLEIRAQKKQRDWDYKLPSLEAVRQAICRMLNAFNPRTEVKPERFLLDFKTSADQQETLSFEQLSDGYRTLLAIVIDLARRMAQANPHLAHPTEDSEAIVLIDEVDLHLHPKWQQTVLSDLMRTFPKAQFIVTTHSDQVLTTVHKENIRLLERCEKQGICAYDPIIEPYGAESSDALHSIMHVNPRPQDLPEVKEYNRYMELINHGQYDAEEALTLRAKLEKILGSNQFNLADMIIRKHKVLGL